MTSEATEFREQCDACRQELARSRDVWTRDDWSVAVRATTVAGHLRPEADVGFASCPRGHRIVVRRAVSRRLAAAG